MSDVTRILSAVDSGDPKAAEELLPLVYTELRRIAGARMAHQPPGQTLQATALVHEAWLKLVGGERNQWNNRRHFFAAASEAMRHILIDRARRRRAEKHGGGHGKVPLDGLELPAAAPGDEETLLAVNEALDLLEQQDPIKAQVVKLRFFVGLQNAEIGDILGVSAKTVQRQWITARAWLFRQLEPPSDPRAGSPEPR